MPRHKLWRAAEARIEPVKVGAYLNVEEALAYLGIDRTRLYKSMDKLDARKAGRRTLISRKSLDRWFARLPKVGPEGRRNRYGHTPKVIAAAPHATL